MFDLALEHLRRIIAGEIDVAAAHIFVVFVRQHGRRLQRIAVDDLLHARPRTAGFTERHTRRARHVNRQQRTHFRQHETT
jgi:hypothetical protein